MSAWKDLLKEPYKKTAISRLAWACETGKSINQHASEDILEVAAELAQLRAALDEARKVMLAWHTTAGAEWLEKYPEETK